MEDRDSLQGKVIIKNKSSSAIEHVGISLELVGAVQRRAEQCTSEAFLSTRVQLASSAESPIQGDAAVFDFDFGQVKFPHESYDGVAVSLRYIYPLRIALRCRYYVRVVLHRKLTDISKEITLCVRFCPKNAMLGSPTDLTSPSPLELEVGLEEFLHIRMTICQVSV